MELLKFKFVFYFGFIALGYLKSKVTKEKKYLLFSFLGFINIITNILDKYILTSNLELFLVNELLSIGLYFMFFNSAKKRTESGKPILIAYILLSLISFLFFIIDWPKTDTSLYSDYRYLNSFEYTIFSLLSGVICIIISTITLIGLLKNDSVPINLLFIIFGIIIFYVGEIILAGLGIHFIQNPNIHWRFSYHLLTIRLYASKSLIITGLLWKN